MSNSEDSKQNKSQIELFDQLYDELKVIAQSHMKNQQAVHTLQPTALVNEAYLKLMAGKKELFWEDRSHFLCTVAEVMRHVLVDSARSKASKKHGGELLRVELSDELAIQNKPHHDILALNEALCKFEKVSAEKAKLVSLRYFSGLSLTEAASALSISRATAYNYWQYSKAWLQRELSCSQ